MQLTPRYGADPVIHLEGPPSAIAGPAIRQRRRLAATVAGFSEEAWSTPSRCDGWTNRDVVAHLESATSFWDLSIRAGLRGEPTRFLATFDPVATPAQIVAGTGHLSSNEVLDRFLVANERLLELLASLDDEGWSTLAEAPPGHLTVSALTHHDLWDAWIHERDISLPLGCTPDEEPDEITACLRYVAGLSPAFALTRGETSPGRLAVDATGPGVSFVVTVGDRVVVGEAGTGSGPEPDATARTEPDAEPDADADADPELRLTGDAVELLEALSVRRPLDQPVPPASAWMIRGLSTIFDAEPA